MSEALTIETRIPNLGDSDGIFSLVKRCPPLDLNSRYAYMLVATHFSDTSVVAIHDKRIIGFVSAYFLPRKPDSFFIWQVAVDPDYREKGLAGLMLSDILMRPHIQNTTTFLETTISPSNTASLGLFKKLVRENSAEITEGIFAKAEDFGADAHEEEILYRIGPLRLSGENKGNQ